MYFLAIETSCDDTSVAIFKNEKLLQVKTRTQLVHKNSGGVIPEIASREHSNNIDELIRQIMSEENLTFEDLSVIVVTQGPGLVNSLQIGIIAAKTLSMIYNIPLYTMNHLVGHIYSPFISQQLEMIPEEAIILLASGGHTMLLYKKKFRIKELSNTRDDSVGESFDKVARILELGYPGGKVIDGIYKDYLKDESSVGELPKFKIPLMNSIEFSYSGLKSKVLQEHKKQNYSKDAIAVSFMKTAIDQLVKKTKLILKEAKINNLFIVGGVSANSLLRESFNDVKDLNVFIPEMQFTTDNAAMIGTAFYVKYKNNDIEPSALDVDSIPRMGIGKTNNE